MSFADVAALAQDIDYQARLSACLYTEALGLPDDPLADFLLRNPPFTGVSAFAPVVAAAPGLGDKFAEGGQASITDGDLLSAVQADWPRIGDLFVPAG